MLFLSSHDFSINQNLVTVMLLGTIFKLDEDDDHAFTLCISFIFLGGVVWEFSLGSIKKEKMKKMGKWEKENRKTNYMTSKNM